MKKFAFNDSQELITNMFDRFFEIDFCAWFDANREIFVHKKARVELISESLVLNFCIHYARDWSSNKSGQMIVEWDSGSFLLVQRMTTSHYIVIFCTTKIFTLVSLYLKNINYISEKIKKRLFIDNNENVIPTITENQEERELLTTQRIQDILLSDPKKLNKYFSKYELIYRPLEIIGGDFYFFKEYEDTLYIILGDCIGYGIEGASTSLTISSLIDAQLNNKNVNMESAFISINKRISQYSFTKVNGYNIGAEFAIIRFNKESLALDGITSGIPIIRLNGKNFEFKKARKRMIDEINNYEQFAWQLNKGELIAIFSNGIMNQFDTSNTKKLGSKGVINIVSTIHQNGELNTSFEDKWDEWKGNTPQIDDALYISLSI